MTHRLRSPLSLHVSTPSVHIAPSRLQLLESLATCGSPPDSPWPTSPRDSNRMRWFDSVADDASLEHFCMKALSCALLRWQRMVAVSTSLEAKVGALLFWLPAGRAWRCLVAHNGERHKSLRLSCRRALRRPRSTIAASFTTRAASFSAKTRDVRAGPSSESTALARGWNSLVRAKERRDHVQKLTRASKAAACRIALISLRRMLYEAELHSSAMQHLRKKSLAEAADLWHRSHVQHALRAQRLQQGMVRLGWTSWLALVRAKNSD